jgi:hypothetical protein
MKMERKRDIERESWIYDEMQQPRLRTVIKIYVQFLSKMNPEEIFCSSRSL